MTRVTVFHYEAFSAIPGKGNPAGIMLDADHLTDSQMQQDHSHADFVVEQGLEIGRDGRARVEAKRQGNGEIDIRVSGRASFVQELEIILDKKA